MIIGKTTVTNSSMSNSLSSSSHTGNNENSGAVAFPSTPVTGPAFEAHAVLALELGARVILANRHRVITLWPLMHAHVQRILSNQRCVLEQWLYDCADCCTSLLPL